MDPLYCWHSHELYEKAGLASQGEKANEQQTSESSASAPASRRVPAWSSGPDFPQRWRVTRELLGKISPIFAKLLLVMVFYHETIT